MSQHLDRRQGQQTYRHRSGLMSPGLQRAREPFRFRNALTGFGLGLLAFGIYSYSINAVKQDVFDDVDEEAKALARTGTSSGAASLPPDGSVPSKPPPITLSKDQEKRIMENAFSVATGTGGSSTIVPKEDRSKTNSTTNSEMSLHQKPGAGAGILQKLTRWLPWPTRKTPPADDLGKISDRQS